MPEGTVKWFNSTKGYGFIQPEDGSADVFVHISALDRAGIGHLAEGTKLSYEVQRDPKRNKSSAENLKLV
jgi:CspA family cold shock protein